MSRRKRETIRTNFKEKEKRGRYIVIREGKKGVSLCVCDKILRSIQFMLSNWIRIVDISPRREK